MTRTGGVAVARGSVRRSPRGKRLVEEGAEGEGLGGAPSAKAERV